MCAQNQRASNEETGSASNNPDNPNSSTLLYLLARQIDHAVKESNQAVDALTSSFTDIMQHVQAIQEAVDKPASAGQGSNITEQCHHINHKMQSAIIAFQFYDKLTQRLAHASSSIDTMAQLAELAPSFISEPQWEETKHHILSTYTIEEDRRYFEATISGQDPNSIALQPGSADAASDDTDIELF